MIDGFHAVSAHPRPWPGNGGNYALPLSNSTLSQSWPRRRPPPAALGLEAGAQKSTFSLTRKKLNLRDIPDDRWVSPQGTFQASSKSLSIALGREPASTDLLKRHPFDVEICRIAPGQKPYPYHSHSAQWEFHPGLSGRGQVRHPEGTTPIGAGDAFLFRPGEPHQMVNDGTVDLVICVGAGNPIGESCHYPDSKKWLVRSPHRQLLRFRSESLITSTARNDSRRLEQFPVR